MRRFPFKGEACIYCGSTTGITREHFIPKNLFLKPRPIKMMTAPACSTCNASYAYDDHYFRTIMAGSAIRDPVGRRVWTERVMPSGYAARAASSRFMAPFPDRVQLPTGRWRVVSKAERKDPQIGRVLGKIVRGLYWNCCNRRLPLDVKLTIALNRSLTQTGRRRIGETIETAHMHRVGDGSVIMYDYILNDTEEGFSIWNLIFYRTTGYTVFTIPAALVGQGTVSSEKAN